MARGLNTVLGTKYSTLGWVQTLRAWSHNQILRACGPLCLGGPLSFRSDLTQTQGGVLCFWKKFDGRYLPSHVSKVFYVQEEFLIISCAKSPKNRTDLGCSDLGCSDLGCFGLGYFFFIKILTFFTQHSQLGNSFSTHPNGTNLTK